MTCLAFLVAALRSQEARVVVSDVAAGSALLAAIWIGFAVVYVIGG